MWSKLLHKANNSIHLCNGVRDSQYLSYDLSIIVVFQREDWKVILLIWQTVSHRIPHGRITMGKSWVIVLGVHAYMILINNKKKSEGILTHMLLEPQHCFVKLCCRNTEAVIQWVKRGYTSSTILVKSSLEQGKGGTHSCKSACVLTRIVGGMLNFVELCL